MIIIILNFSKNFKKSFEKNKLFYGKDNQLNNKEYNKNESKDFQIIKDSKMLSQKEVSLLLKEYSIKFPEIYIIDEKKDIHGLKLNFPVVLKIDSSEIIHKSDYGLVFTNINSYLELHKKVEIAEQILNKNNIKAYSFVIQEMIKGKELILGMKKDPVFGKIILLGLGGIFVELMKDFSIRVLPIKEHDCYEMISELKGEKFLENYRNTKAINKSELVNLMLNFSKLCIEKEFTEIDFNPIIANEKDCYVVDARIIK